jgi:hypothetical protein
MSLSGGALSATFIYARNMLENFIANTWNRCAAPTAKPLRSGLELGRAVIDGQIRHHVYLPHEKRPEHISILGKTGQGKSSLLRNMGTQDVRSRRGFLLFDLHGDLTSYLLALIALEEQHTREDLSEKLIVVDPSDPEYSVGLNVLEANGQNTFVQLAEFAQILKQRWHLDSFGARTEELLRNSLYVLAENRLTLVEMSPLLTNNEFRAACLQRAANGEVEMYFRERFEAASEAMQATMREPILNKISTFTADPHFRHIVGQQHSTISLQEAMDRGWWVILHLNKGRLGEQAVTLGALLLAKLKNALFSRQQRSLFTLYCDEIQNLVSIDSGLDTVLSEARKFGVSVVSANQFLAQFPPSMQAAILAVGTQIFFQLSSGDADKIASALDGGKRLGELLKNLARRHIVLKTGSERWQEVLVGEVAEVHADFSDLYRRTRTRWTRRRTAIEEQIASRVRPFAARNRAAAGGLDDWES